MKDNFSDKNSYFDNSQNNNMYRLNPTDKYRSKTVTISSILLLFVVFIVSLGLIFKTGDGSTTLSFLESEDYTIGDIKVKGVQLKVYQNNGSGYTDVTDTGFDLNTKTFATDVKYNYDLIIKNDEKAEVTADQYYLRWYFTAIVDNIEYDITQYTTVDSAYVYLQEDTDGKTRYYSVNGNQSNVISAQNQLAFLSSIRFDGVYDNLTKKYGSILDDEFSGSKIKIVSHIEGSLTPYQIILPAIKIYDKDGNVLAERTPEEKDGQLVVTMPSETPTSSVEVDGETLYFQGWTKNGQNNVLYTPNSDVEVGENDVFTPYYSTDPDYSDFAFTVDSVTGEYILSGANKNATSITIPALNKGEKVTVIKDSAFYSYTKLETVNMPQTITKIGNHAFFGCTNLETIDIPDSVTTIGDSAFYNCTNLKNINIPDSVTNIGEYAFYDCTNLTSITIPNGVTVIDSYAFRYTGLTSIVIPDSVTSLGSQGNAFSGCYNLTTVVIGNGVKELMFYDFNNCRNLTSVTLGNSIQGIGECVFANCKKLTYLKIPASTTYIFSDVFYECDLLEQVEFENTEGWYTEGDEGWELIDVSDPYEMATKMKDGLYLTKEP